MSGNKIMLSILSDKFLKKPLNRGQPGWIEYVRAYALYLLVHNYCQILYLARSIHVTWHVWMIFHILELECMFGVQRPLRTYILTSPKKL